jgi:hypothetical protein
MTALRFLMTAHFPTWRAIVTNYLECFGEIFIREDLTRKEKQLLLVSKGPKPINCRPKSDKESGVRHKPRSIKGHIREIQVIPEK